MTPYDDADNLENENENEVSEYKKRAPAINKKISQISKNDLRVAVVGTIIDYDEKNLFFTIDDSESKINVILLDEQLMKNIRTGKIVRVIGTIIGNDSGIEIKGEFVQDFTGLNVNYYNKYLNLIFPKN